MDKHSQHHHPQQQQQQQQHRSSRNWAGLPPELIVSIAERVPIPYYLHLRLVCTSWSSALLNLHPKALHFPWLSLTRDSSNSNSNSNSNNNSTTTNTDVIFLCSAEQRCYRLPRLPSFHSKLRCVGWRDGWLSLLDEETTDIAHLRLLNPLTGAQLMGLPSLSTLPQYSQSSSIKKVVLSPVKEETVVIAVVLYGVFSERQAFARLGDEVWTPLRLHSANVDDIAYHSGLFYAVLSSGEVESFNLSDGKPEPSSLGVFSAGNDNYDNYSVKLDDVYLVSTAPLSGDLLQVRGKRSWESGMSRSFSIMKFVPKGDRGLSSWVEVKNLGDASLFLDGKHCMLLDARDVPGLVANCIYFAAQHLDSLESYANDAGVFDINYGGITRSFPVRSKFSHYYSFPPIWFLPST